MEEQKNETMGDRLKRMRIQKGWSLRKAADEIGVFFTALDKWEKGENLTIRDPATLYRIAKVYGTDPAYILFGDDRKPPPDPSDGTGRFRKIG